MEVTLTASTAAKIVVWKDGDLYHARRLGQCSQPQVCLAVDLFEVIAELAGLNLEQASQAAEASALSEQAQDRLVDGSAVPDGSLPDADGDEPERYESRP